MSSIIRITANRRDRAILSVLAAEAAKLLASDTTLPCAAFEAKNIRRNWRRSAANYSKNQERCALTQEVAAGGKVEKVAAYGKKVVYEVELPFISEGILGRIGAVTDDASMDIELMSANRGVAGRRCIRRFQNGREVSALVKAAP